MRGRHDPHDVLGIPRGASPDVVQAAYRRLARLHHPDAPGGDADRMRELNAAYDALRQPPPDGGPAGATAGTTARPADRPAPRQFPGHSNPTDPPRAEPRPPMRLPSRRAVVVALLLLGAFVAGLAVLASTGTETLEPTTAQLVASGRHFDLDAVRLRAGTDVEVHLVNHDVGYRHNVAILHGAAVVARGEPVTGPTAVTYEVGPLPAGTYEMRCEIFPAMTARLTVA